MHERQFRYAQRLENRPVINERDAEIKALKLAEAWESAIRVQRSLQYLRVQRATAEDRRRKRAARAAGIE